jgi:RNA polymerase sigma-70 factor (ECF subfamily)
VTGALGVPFACVGGHAPDAEDEITARLRAGERSALGDAYDTHHAHVRAFAQRMLGDEAAAEDLVQETFLALPRAATRFRGGSSLRTFLVSIAVNHAKNHVRAAARRRAATVRLGLEPAPAATGPAERLERAELASRLMRALDTLPIEQRAAIVLCEIEERTGAEVAAILGVPEATVRTRVFHAKRKLAEALGDSGDNSRSGGGGRP